MQSTRFITRQEVKDRFNGKTVAIVGGGPSAANNERGKVDSHDIVVRVNNYRLNGDRTGRRTDVFYSFFGSSIRKPKEELIADGVTLCMCKCPNAHAIQSDWHVRRGKMIGVDYRPHYLRRRNWWFCDTYIPEVSDFLVWFELLGRRVPTTGFSAILDILSFSPRKVFLTGFDFYKSKIHNLTDVWSQNNADDPIGHNPMREQKWLLTNLDNYPVELDRYLMNAVARKRHFAEVRGRGRANGQISAR